MDKLNLISITECLRCESSEISHSDGDISLCHYCYDFYITNDLLLKLRNTYKNDECVGIL